MYGYAASELCRQLRVENRGRAILVERILSRPWTLTDELLPVLAEHATSRKAAWVQTASMKRELAEAEREAGVLREHIALSEMGERSVGFECDLPHAIPMRYSRFAACHPTCARDVGCAQAVVAGRGALRSHAPQAARDNRGVCTGDEHRA